MNMIDTETYRDSLTTLLRNKNKAGLVDDPKYVAGAQRVLDFMHNNWQRQKLCDVIISANNGDLQVSTFRSLQTVVFLTPTDWDHDKCREQHSKYMSGQ